MKNIIRFSILFIASTCFAQMYTLNEIGTPTTAQLYVNGINNSGQVVGSLYDFGHDPNGPYVHSFLYSNGAVTDIGIYLTLSDNYGYGINDSGQIVGSFFPPPYTNLHAYLYGGGVGTDLGTLGGSVAEASGINATGQVTGYSLTPDNRSHAFLYSKGTMMDIGELGGGWSRGIAINDSGEITGSSLAAGAYVFSRHAFLYSAGKTKDLGTLGGLQSEGHAINAFGQVTGTSATSIGNGWSPSHAFLYSDGKMKDLGTLSGEGDSSGNGIDSWGQITGSSSGVAALYSNGKWQDLNNLIRSASGWMLWSAGPINDAGQIAGIGFTSDGAQLGFLLNPIYKAFVRPPINADGSSVFSGKRGVIPVKFTLNQYNAPTCTLPGANITLTRAARGTLGLQLDESTYVTAADDGSNFRIDQTACNSATNTWVLACAK